MGDIDWLIAVGGGSVITDTECLPEFSVRWTAVGIMGVEESGNAIARRLFVLIVLSTAFETIGLFFLFSKLLMCLYARAFKLK